MTLVESVLAVLGVSLGGVTVGLAGWSARRVRRSYWWLVARHTVAARVLALVPSMAGEALVHRLKRELLRAVAPAPVLQSRRVPARIELVVPEHVLAELGTAADGLADDLAAWLTHQARWRDWALPRPAVRVRLTPARSGPTGGTRRQARSKREGKREGKGGRCGEAVSGEWTPEGQSESNAGTRRR